MKEDARLGMHVTRWGETGAHVGTAVKPPSALCQAIHLELHRCTGTMGLKGRTLHCGTGPTIPEGDQPFPGRDGFSPALGKK